MAKLTLQAGSTFWFDYPGDQPPRYVFPGQTFTIEDKDFALFEVVGTEIVEGKLPTPKPKLVERVAAKVAQVLGVTKPEKPSEKVACPECGQVFKNERGLEIHIGHAHKELAEKNKAEELQRLRDEGKALEAALNPQTKE